MDILRPDSNGIYHCINNPENKTSYMLVDRKGYIPTLIHLDKLHISEAEPLNYKHFPSHAGAVKDDM